MFDPHYKGTLISVTCKRTMQPYHDWRTHFAGLAGGIYVIPSGYPGLHRVCFCPEDDEVLKTSAGEVSVTDDTLTIDTHNSIYEFALTV